MGRRKLVGPRFAACMWIYTKAVLCDGQESTMESVIWVCKVALEDHGWVSELTISVRKQNFWWLLITTAKLPASSGGECCGFRHQQK